MNTKESINQARIDLTAALRNAALLGLHEGVCNHFSYAIPSTLPTCSTNLYYLEQACMVQVLAQSAGKPLRIISEEVAAKTAQQFEQERQQSILHFEALKQNLDRTWPDWSSLSK
jgi:ribulose-5-phosphate 4-epimerase/fuculose-1-phosphate aldolase